MLNGLVNIDGNFINPSWIHAILPHEILSQTCPGYKIKILMGGEEFKGKTLYKTEQKCIDAITKLFEDDVEEYMDNDDTDEILDKIKDCEEEVEFEEWSDEYEAD